MLFFSDEIPSSFSDLLDNLHTLQKENSSLREQLTDAHGEQSSNNADSDVKVLEAALKRSEASLKQSKQAVARLVQEKEQLVPANRQTSASSDDVESVRAAAEQDFMEMRAVCSCFCC